MKKLRWDPIAKEQITEIFHFYKTRCGLRTAKKITDAIRQSSKRLKEQPLLGFREPLLLKNPYEYRSLVEGNYKSQLHIPNPGTLLQFHQRRTVIEECFYILGLHDSSKQWKSGQQAHKHLPLPEGWQMSGYG